MFSAIIQVPLEPDRFTCTVEHCGLRFDRAAWEAHEKSAHSPPLELWKCCVEKCKHVSYLRETHATHLAQKHKVTDKAEMAMMILDGHVGGGTFWCGFCREVIAPVRLKWVHLAEHYDDGAKIEEYVFV